LDEYIGQKYLIAFERGGGFVEKEFGFGKQTDKLCGQLR